MGACVAIRAVTFDVWDTLLNLKVAREAMISAVARETGRPEAMVREAVSEADRAVRRERRLRGLGAALRLSGPRSPSLPPASATAATSWAS
jgi:hypothetical protein